MQKFDNPTFMVASNGGSGPDVAPTAVTLFSGIGSSSLALRNLGHDVLAHELMPEAVSTLNANGFDVVAGDIRQVDFKAPWYDDVEVLVGGPPCQPFSQAHDGDGQYDPRDMIPDFVRAVRDIEPKVFIMEEVKTLTWAKHRDYLVRILADLMNAGETGYSVDYKVLDSSRYGVGQARKRLFVVGVRNDIANERRAQGIDPVLWPHPDSDDILRTMADTLGWDLGDAYEANQRTPRPGGDYSWVFERPAPTVVGSFRADVAAKPGWRKPGDGPRQNTPGSVSTTHTERLILQGLPTDWVVSGSTAKRDLQIGNSCPTPLLERLISANL